MSIFGAFFGGLPTATYSQNVGIVTVNKVINRIVFLVAAVILMIAGFIPVFSAALTTIPQSVIGGATLSVFAQIAMTGVRMFTKDGLTARKTTVVGMSVALGVGITQVADCLSGPGLPGWINSIFGSSSVVVATIMAILLNLILPKEETAAETTEEMMILEDYKYIRLYFSILFHLSNYTECIWRFLRIGRPLVQIW